MTMKFSGSKTEKNLLAAFAGESQARNRYSFFSKRGKEGRIRADRGGLFEDYGTEREGARGNSFSSS